MLYIGSLGIALFLLGIFFLKKKQTVLALKLHDLRNTLTVLQSLSSLMEKSSQNDKGKIYASQLELTCQKARLQINDIFSFQNHSKSQFAPVCLNEIVDVTFRVWQSSLPENIKLEIELPHDKLFVWGDKVLLERMLDNLLQNAQKALPEGGNIKIICQKTFLSYQNLKNCFHRGDAGECVQLCVEDNGKGIKPSLFRKIFRPFYHSFALGNGLGLASVAQIVKEHKASLRLENIDGNLGCRFFVYLPMMKKDTSKAKILIVDDDAMQRALLAELVKGDDFILFTAQTSQAALQILSQNPDISLLITDMFMPQMNGDLLYKNLLQVNPSLKALFLSGKKCDIPFENAAFLEKPYKISEIKNLINSLLAKHLDA